MKNFYSFFASSEEQHALSDAGLHDFHTIWNLEAPWFEALNKRRNGWSGVITWPLATPLWFVKRQENHNTKTIIHPLRGVPTYQREFHNLVLFQKAEVPTLSLSYYGERISEGNHQAILITRALNHHQDLYKWYTANQNNEALVTSVMQKLALVIRQMHDKKLYHYCLYPNHIFIHAKTTASIDIRLIDLEKARHVFNTTQGRIKDLDCLFRHTHDTFSATHLQCFIDSYLAQPLSHADKVRRTFSTRGA